MRNAIEFAVPARVLGVLDSSGLFAGIPERFTSPKPSPPGPAYSVVPKGGTGTGALLGPESRIQAPFSGLVPFFLVFKNTEQKHTDLDLPLKQNGHFCRF